MRRLRSNEHFQTASEAECHVRNSRFRLRQVLRCRLRSRTALAAENLFLRKQLALFKEREKKAVPTTAADRFVLSKLARFFDWRSALVIVKPAS
jgi:hypothetical protein